MKATIWHNPRCGTSRNALAILQEAGVGGHGRRVSALAPGARRAEAGLCPRRHQSARWAARKEPAAQDLAAATDAEIIDAMMLNPVLIERPIVETDKGAILARPAERVREIL
jgi:arsenate reductase